MDVVAAWPWWTGERPRSSPASTTTHGSASRPMWWQGPPPGRPVTPWPWPWAATAHPTRSSPTTARSSPAALVPARARCSSTAYAGRDGIRHLLTAPRSPTTTGKVERFHKTLRCEFLTGKVFASIEEAQAALDAWVSHYNHERPHQSIGMVAPSERFRLAATEQVTTEVSAPPEVDPTASAATRRVGANGLTSFAAAKFRAGVWLAGQDVTVVCDGGLVHLQHRGVLIATHARRHSIDKQSAAAPCPGPR